MIEDVFPAAAEPFHIAQGKFIDAVSADPAAYGMTPAEVAALKTEQAVYETARQKHIDKDTEARAATKEYDTAHAGYLAALRPTATSIHAHTGITEAQLTAATLKPHDRTRHHLGAPSTRPLGRIVEKGALRQEIHWADESTPHKRAKPHGYHHCELWLKIDGPAPVDETTCHQAASDSASPYLYEFEPADAGKTAYWLLRWVSPKGEKGPWGAVVSGKING